MSDSHPFFSYLKERIQRPLPGKKAHLQMAPSPLNGDMVIPDEPDHRACLNSVMILLSQVSEHQLELILTVRCLSLAHGGQISFPGGQSEPGESIEETALREMEEEIGIRQRRVDVIGPISRLYLNHTDNLIIPVLGSHSGSPEIIRNPEEVEEVFTVSLDSLLDDRNLIKEQWELQNRVYEVPFWNVHRVPLWGATAMMTNELLTLYREFLK